MSIAVLLRHADTLITTPQDVAKLRQLILAQAVQGKLVPQEAGDEPAEVLLGDIALCLNGDRSSNYPSKSARVTAGVPFINAGHLVNGVIDYSEMDYISEQKYVSLSGGKIQGGDLLYCLRGSLGKCAVVKPGEYGAIASSLMIIRPKPLILPEYLYFYLISPRGQVNITHYDNGSAQPNLSAANVKKYPIPLPPLAEQRRIVARVDELMAHCDQLEAQLQARVRLQQRVVQAALARVYADPSPTSIATLLDPKIGASPTELRQLILTLAVQGKLVPQEAGDEPLDVNYLQYLNSFSIELPKSWGAVQIGKYCDIEGGSQPPKEKFINHPKPGYVRMYQIRDLGDKPVPVYIPIQSTTKYCYDGDILIGRYGASVGKIFWARNGTYNVALAKFIYPKDIYESSFVFLLLKSNFFQSKIKHISRSAQAGFNKSDIADIYIPLPPLAEQRRIVARVDELMALVDRLEAQQTQASILGAQVLDALVGGV